MKLDLSDIAEILGSRWPGPPRSVSSYSIDSRTVKPGQLFFAIRGPRFDGHEFVREALAKGAAGAVVSEAFGGESTGNPASPLIRVRDTTEAFGALAAEARTRWDGRLVAITGSTGKTTTKEMAAKLLSRRFSVLKSQGNLNNLFGLPQALLALEPSTEVAVVELGMSAPGEIARLARMAGPDMGVVTNVAPVHLEFFDSIEGIARAKRELIENLAFIHRNPTAVLNNDDPFVREFGRTFGGRVVTFGFSAEADVRGEAIAPTPSGGSRFSVSGRLVNGQFEIKLPGRHNVQNALAALAVAGLFGVTAEDARATLAEVIALGQRGEVIELANGVTVINDSYNSNPRAMESILETLREWPGARRKIVVAGEMRELGKTSPDLHRSVGRKMAEIGAEFLVAVAGDARYFVEAATAAGFASERASFFETAEDAGEYCRSIVRPGDVVLVKGSRGVRLELVVELLTRAGNPDKAKQEANGHS